MRTLIVANRAPISIVNDDGKIRYSGSSGGLVSGLTAYINKLKTINPTQEILWIGWPGGVVDDEEKIRAEILEKYGTYSVFLEEELMERFYNGFCNNTIWPLFHYFPYFTNYDHNYWNTYIEVNEIYCKSIVQNYRPGDIIWIHDYHLLLLPALIREQIPNATIGFFLHIPFPSYENFRLLPSEWRMNILKGMLGADLIGFHTHDYRTYFLRSVLRILGLSNDMGEINYFNRIVKIDSFPMGIDYEKYHSAANSLQVISEKNKLKKNFGDKRLILSIDRQDYSKGILNRLKGFEYFLNKYPEFNGKVMLIMIVIPSRVRVEDYMEIKNNIDQLAGQINGTYGTLNGMPILYQYRSLSFEELIALYSLSDIALVTPLRDGMNLVAKEYLACKRDGKGVLIISEMAGAADELSESIIINPNNIEEIGEAIKNALLLDENIQNDKLVVMQKRLKEYNVFKWADSFLTTLKDIKEKQLKLAAKILPDNIRSNILSQFENSNQKIIFLDYDGTLQPFTNKPEDAVPKMELIDLLKNLLQISNVELVIISGRDCQMMENWFGHLSVNLVAEHGLFIREKNKSWKIIKPVRRTWKKKILSLMNESLEKLPNSLIEEKDYSVAFHFRRCDPDLASLRVMELVNKLTNFTVNLDVQILRGNKVIEVRNAGIDKGVAAMHWLNEIKDPSHFILAIGDDLTDEDLFRVIPAGGYSIKVGRGTSYAMYNLISSNEVLQFLNELAEYNNKSIIRA